MNYTPPADLLKDKVIMVTGAGDGIGRAVAKAYGAHGATVILAGRTVAKLEAVYDELVAAGAPEPGIAPMDLTNVTREIVEELAGVIHTNYGRLDGLLHNAALLGSRVPLEHYDVNEWMRVIQVNFNAEFLLTRLLMPLLRIAPTASLLFTTSSVGTAPRAYWGAYAVSKYAVEGFAKLLHEELENTSDIRVNLINPGGTRTPMRAAAFPVEDPMTLKTPEDITPLYLYPMGENSRAEKGQLFTSDWPGHQASH